MHPSVELTARRGRSKQWNMLINWEQVRPTVFIQILAQRNCYNFARSFRSSSGPLCDTSYILALSQESRVLLRRNLQRCADLFIDGQCDPWRIQRRDHDIRDPELSNTCTAIAVNADGKLITSSKSRCTISPANLVIDGAILEVGV